MPAPPDGADLGWQDARVLLFGRLIGAFPGEARYEMPAFTLLAKTVNSLMKVV